MSLYQRFILFFIGLFTSFSLYSQPGYQRVRIPVETVATAQWVKEKIRNQYPDFKNIELQLQDEIHSPGGIHFTFIQTSDSIPIYGAGIKVNLLPKTRITSFLSNLTSFPSQKPLPFSYSEDNIMQRMAEVESAYEVQIEPNYFLKNGLLTPIYKTIIHSYGPTASQEILINAINGKEISRRDRGTYYHYTDTDTSGKARVFIPNPCTHAEVEYGDLFIDSMDLHKPIFDQFIDTVVLKDLTYEGGIFKLEGPYVRVNDRTSFFIPPATSTNGEFYFNRDESGFEDAMVYYHIDTMQRLIQSLGFTNLQNAPLEVDPHGKGNQDQSVFVANGGNSYILFGEGGVDDAEDADVIIHEYAHAISYAASPNTNSGTERRGLDEGIGDYFAAIYSIRMNPHYGWDKIFNWDGHNEFWGGRTVTSNRTYPPTNTSIYTYGEIWASTLMKIREEIGAERTDSLALQELYGNFTLMKLPDAGQLLLDADTALNNGANTEMIAFQLCESGILSGADCLKVNLDDSHLKKAFLKIYPNPVREDFTIEWDGNQAYDIGSFSLINVLGQEVFRASGFKERKLHITESFPTGFYNGILRINATETIIEKIEIK